MENCFGTNLNDNGNSFSSCFQFEEQPRPGHIRRRIKVYNKLLALTQCASVQKSIGMNTKAIFYSDAKMYKELREACQEGLGRIEISYYAEDHKQ